jgi:acetyl esterase/lipase
LGYSLDKKDSVAKADIPVSWQTYLVCFLLRWLVKRRFRPETNLTRYRQRIERMDTRFIKLASDIHTTELYADNVSAHWVEVPESTSKRVILYLHGGGFCLRGPNLYRNFLARLCRQTQAKGLLLDYRLTPEHPYPAAMQDCLAGYRWLLHKGHDAKDIIIAGDSAGGCLSLVTVTQLRDAGEPQPACAALLSPATDMTVSGLSAITKEREDPFFYLQTLLLLKHHYLQGAFAGDPGVSPLYADFQGLPPLLFQTGSTELLLDDSLHAASKAKAAGVKVDLQVWQRMPHVFQLFTWLPESHQALKEIGQFVKMHTPHTDYDT